MPVVTLPDGSTRQFDHLVSAAEVVANIGKSLAKAAVAAQVDGRLVDLSTVIDHDVSFAAITADSEEGVDVIRHSSAHLLAQAVKSLFPDAQVTIGPTVENGFYYDFAIDRPFTSDDLGRIEAKMQELARADLPISREIMPREQAIAMFEAMGERYKAEIIREIPEGENISLYRQGEFMDLCRGPHVPSTGRLKAFKLTRLAGAYWRGDSRNPMLQRIYGTAWARKEDLDAYLQRLEEAERRDHRRLGRQLDLFHMQEEAPGMVFWHPHGWAMWQQVEQYMRAKFHDHGYQEIKTPTIMDRSLWERSGHWENYRDNMFTTASEHRDYAVKPMNCPGHVQVFNHGLHSYRDLPLRLAEFGSCHRNEPSGALHGLMRVRAFVQDDAHIFCTEEQVQEEVSAFIQMLQSVYADFGFRDVLVKLSTRPEKRVGTDESWDRAEKALTAALEQNGLAYELQPGEGAFYGPKIEFTLTDSIGRLWQCGTIQLDFNLPVRLGAEYVAEDNTRRPPVMLHRAILGSMERFIGILIEHYAGNLPVWLSPVQVVVLNITDAQGEYARNCAEKLQKMGFRCNADLRNEKIGFKIRAHTLQRVPYLLVAGAREQEAGTVAVRTREGQDLGVMSLEQFAVLLGQKVKDRSPIDQVAEG